MEIVLTVIAVVILVAIVWGVLALLRARDASRTIRREKLDSVTVGHREMAAAHEGSIEELRAEAQTHRDAAAHHARRADELDERIEHKQRQAQFHEERAAETETEREQIR